MGKLVGVGYLLPDDAREEFGYQTGLVLSSPIVGTPVQRRTPGEFYEIIVAARIVLFTNAVVAARNVVLSVIDGDGNTIAAAWAPQSQAASLNVTYEWSSSLGSAYVPTATVMQTPLFSVLIVSGWIISFNAQNLQAGDQFASPALVLQQYNTGLQADRFVGLAPIASETLGLSSTVTTPVAEPTPIPTTTAAPAAASAPASTSAPPPPPPPPAPAAAPPPPVFDPALVGTGGGRTPRI